MKYTEQRLLQVNQLACKALGFRPTARKPLSLFQAVSVSDWTRGYLAREEQVNRLAAALHPGPVPHGVFRDHSDEFRWSHHHAGMEDYEVQDQWCEKANIYEELTDDHVRADLPPL